MAVLPECVWGCTLYNRDVDREEAGTSCKRKGRCAHSSVPTDRGKKTVKYICYSRFGVALIFTFNSFAKGFFHSSSGGWRDELV